MMTSLNLKSLGMHECKALHGTFAKVYIRKGKCFVYVGDQRYEITPLSKEDAWQDEELSKNVKTVSVDFSKDFSYEGYLHFHENEVAWIFGITNPSNRSNPLTVVRLEPKPTLN